MPRQQQRIGRVQWSEPTSGRLALPIWPEPRPGSAARLPGGGSQDTSRAVGGTGHRREAASTLTYDESESSRKADISYQLFPSHASAGVYLADKIRKIHPTDAGGL